MKNLFKTIFSCCDNEKKDGKCNKCDELLSDCKCDEKNSGCEECNNENGCDKDKGCE